MLLLLCFLIPKVELSILLHCKCTI